MGMLFSWMTCKVPGTDAWRDGLEDPAVRALHARLNGCTATVAQALLASGGWGDWLDGMLFAPSEVFRFYVRVVAEYLGTPSSAGDFETAATFLVLLNARTRLDLPSVCGCLLEDAVAQIAARPAFHAVSLEEQAELCVRATRVRSGWAGEVREWQPVTSENRELHAPS